MIRLYTSEQGVYQLDFIAGETAGDFINRFKTELGVHFNGNSLLQETYTGRSIPNDEIMLERDYYLTAWLAKA